MNGIDRLLMLQQDTVAAGLALAEQRPRFELLASRQLDGTAPKAITGFNLFQTPRPIAEKMAQLLMERTEEGARILEPSAGLGRLYEPLKELRAEWLMVEDQMECCKALADMMKRANIQNRDFLTTTPDSFGGQVDAVIMNPPFKQGRDVKHIMHALDMLKPGGRLVSLCYNGTKQKKHLQPIADHWEVLPANSFRKEGTGADVALLVIDK